MNFGNLTLLVGPQGSGKSLFLELFKLIVDRKHVISTLKRYNYILKKDDAKNIIEDYFGEGMASLFDSNPQIMFNGNSFDIKDLLVTLNKTKLNGTEKETVFYIPAQRILSMPEGRPKNFSEYDIASPYVLRIFSETLRVFLQGGLGSPNVIFPMRNRLKGQMKKNFNDAIFHNAQVVLDESTGQRKMKLRVGDMLLPFMTWSAGQKEFMPLLLAIYCLSGPPTSVIDKAGFEWVIIEEPEMGLHPKAIEAVLLEVIELIQSGYKVIISTHSSTLLDFAWTFNFLKSLPEEKFKSAMGELFSVSASSSAIGLFDGLRDKEVKTYYSSLGKNGAELLDISDLDACSERTEVSDWGGLVSFSSLASDIVSKYANQME